MGRCCPPTRECSPEDRVKVRGQLRLGSGNRRTADCWNRTSVEKGAHRRKALAPVRGCFAGAGARGKCVPPGRPCSPEDRLRLRAQLRPTFARRRRTNTEEPNSVEKGAHRRKAPAPVRVLSPEMVRARRSYLRGDIVRRRTRCESALSSGEKPVTGGGRIPKSPTPLIKALTGGKHQVLLGLSSPGLVRGGNAYLRGDLARRRTDCDYALSSGQHSLAGGGRISKSPTPSRRALTGGRHQLLLGFSRRRWCEREGRTSG